MKQLGLLFIAMLLLASTSYAQDSNEQDDKGMYLGASLLGASWNIPDLDLDSERGGGFGLRIGYNFNTNVAMFFSLDGSRIDPEDGNEYSLAHGDLGVEGRFGDRSSMVRPFLRGSLVGMASVSGEGNDEVTISGGGLGLGAGLYFFLSPNASLSLGYTHSWINLSEVKVGAISVEVDENAESGRLGIGFAWHF
ncbi:MAG: outer membrane beta-barrel protein [Balneolaceae bacterium]